VIRPSDCDLNYHFGPKVLEYGRKKLYILRFPQLVFVMTFPLRVLKKKKKNEPFKIIYLLNVQNTIPAGHGEYKAGEYKCSLRSIKIMYFNSLNFLKFTRLIFAPRKLRKLKIFIVLIINKLNYNIIKIINKT
jgi:hypothetical protein